MRSFTITILPQSWQFLADAGTTLLAAAELAGIRLLSSCRNGTCRTCISRVVDGRIEHRIPWPGLSAEEKAEGLILPCVAEPRSDVTLRQD